VFEIVEQYGFTATHQIHGLEPGHACVGVHPHRWIAEVVLTSATLMPTDGQSEQAVLEPLREYVAAELDGKHLNDLFPGAPTPARVAWHLASWYHGHIAKQAYATLTAVVVSAGPSSRVRYTVPRAQAGTKG
jgi:6-pyruvoyltetrahydropterin/6-carboxytetrahydropterin synthase